jgi:hypothetical protein
MKIATVSVCAAIYVPAGQYLNGAVLASPQWARPGTHTMEAEFAQAQDAAGMLEVESIDGAPVVWASCCGGDHNHG